MAMLQCEICGGKLKGKPGGIYECEFCGVEYDTAWAKAKIQEIEGTVQVEGTVDVKGTVKVDGPVEVKGRVSIESLLKRAMMSLEDGDWSRADDYCEKVLDINPECAEAYLGKLLAQLKIYGRAEAEVEEGLRDVDKDIKRLSNFKKAMRFADDTLKAELQSYADFIEAVREAEEGTEGCEVRGDVLEEYTGTSKTVIIPTRVHKIDINALACNEKITAVVISDNVERIESYTFCFCKHLSTITIPDSVVDIEEGAFVGCEKLNNIRISNTHPKYRVIDNCIIDTTTKTVIFGNAFSKIPADGCATSIGAEAFGGCVNLKTVTIPDSIVNISDGTFFGCEKLNDIRISKDHPKYQVIDNCIIDTGAKMVIFGNAFSKIPADGCVTSIGASAFSGHENLLDVTIPNGIITIGAEAFLDCHDLTTVIIPNSVTTIGNRAFNCAGSAITIPDSVISIGEGAFTADCVYTPLNSYAARWCQEKGLNVEEDEISKQKRLEAEKLQQEIMAQRRREGLCQHCGGELKGFLILKCTSCGRSRDY